MLCTLVQRWHPVSKQENGPLVGPRPGEPPPPGRPGSGVTLCGQTAVQTLHLVPSMLAEPAVRGAKEKTEELVSTALYLKHPVPA